MDVLLIIIGILVYLVVGRVFAQIYTNVEGFDPWDYHGDIFVRTLIWPLLLIWWGVDKMVEWIDDNFF